MPEPDHDLPLDAEGDAAIYVLSRLSGEGNDRPVEGDVKLCASEKRDILAALRSGELSRAQLEVNASRLYRTWQKLQ